MTKPCQSVLLVDDDPHTRAIFELLMEYYEMPFSVAHDSAEAIDHLRRHSPDVIVIDLFLPGTDGFQVLKTIRPLPEASQCRILATTAYYTNDTWREVLARGFDGYLPKPFVPDSFIAYLCGTVDD